MTVRLLILTALIAVGQLAALPVDCSSNRHALAAAIEHAVPGDTLTVSGICEGGVRIAKDLNLVSQTEGTISGGSSAGRDGIEIVGPARVTVQGLEIENGLNGIHGKSGAQLTILDTQVNGNTENGILLEGQSSATLRGDALKGNGLNGLDAEATSSVTLRGNLLADGNAVFGVNINGSSSLTLANGHLTVSNNVLGIQFGTSAAGFISDPVSTIRAEGNFTTGFTVVSGAHFVAFGGTITSTNNGGIGISVDSKAGFDMDAAALVSSTHNVGDGLHIEETSVVTMFNTPAFSGAPGTTTLEVTQNGQNGISILTGSNLTVIHQATITDEQNGGFGIYDDNGSSVTLIQSTISDNPAGDVSVTFGSRADISTSKVGKFTCDATALVRGPGQRNCPR